MVKQAIEVVKYKLQPKQLKTLLNLRLPLPMAIWNSLVDKYKEEVPNYTDGDLPLPPKWEDLPRRKLPIDGLFGGSKGPGKSWLLCVFVYIYCKLVTTRFSLKPKKEVPHIGWIGRKIGSDFVGTTLQEWIKTIPEASYELKSATEKHPKHILIDKVVAVDYGGLDNLKDVNKFNSAEYGFVGLDQAEETTKDDVAVLLASRRMKLRNPKTGKMECLPYCGLFTANPRACWLKDEFIDEKHPHRFFVPSVPRDNRHLPEHYIKTLEDSFSHRPDLLRAYIDGIWEGLSKIDQVILDEWITAAKTRYIQDVYRKRLVSVDPARFGDDKCVILGLENTNIIDAEVLPYCGEPDIVTAASAMSHRLAYPDAFGRVHDATIVVETVGVCGVGDYLIKEGKTVIQYSPADRLPAEEDCYNNRSLAWSTVAKWMQKGVYDSKMGAAFSLAPPEDEALLSVHRSVCKQLTWPSYKFRGRQVLIQPKIEIKAEHGESPDHADAYVNGVYHLPMIQPVYFTEEKVGYAGVMHTERSGGYGRGGERHPMDF